MTSGHAFPVIYTKDVGRLARFYALLGFDVVYQFPPDGEPGYASLKRGVSELGITDASWPKERIGVELGKHPRFEMFVYVEQLDSFVEELRHEGVPVLADPDDMPWGERLAYVADPDGNPVVLAQNRP